jgi:ribulose-5-phosphate 4-epimerase/fuculose-1-phosphate aldolase
MNAEMLAKKKHELAQAVRTLAGGGILTLTVGHASWRDADSGNIVVLGHAHKEHKTLDRIGADDIVVMDPDGKLVDGRYGPPGELFIHTEIYRARPEVMAVVHGHPLHCIAFSLHNRPLFPFYYRAGQFVPSVNVLDYAGQIDTVETGRRAAAALGAGMGLLLRGHGSITVGASIEEAAVNAFTLEDNARILLLASVLGEPKALNPDDLKLHKPTSVWTYYVHSFDPQTRT